MQGQWKRARTNFGDGALVHAAGTLSVV